MFPFLLIHILFLFQNSWLPINKEHEKKIAKRWPEIVFVPEEQKVAYKDVGSNFSVRRAACLGNGLQS